MPSLLSRVLTIAAVVIALASPGQARADDPAMPKVVTNSIGMKFAEIPAGEFDMGSPPKDQDADAKADERPQHKVRVSAFRMGVTEVTIGQFRRYRLFVEATRYKTEDERAQYRNTWRDPHFEQTDQHPVVDVSWNEAVAYCNWLSRLDGLKEFYKINGNRVTVPDWKANGYRLPTEAEWEYACRAGTKTPFSCPEDELGRHAWYGDNYGRGPHRVGEKLPNKFGLFDMQGNVDEWCWDFYDNAYYKGLSGVSIDPRGPNAAFLGLRVLRGSGGWGGSADDLRSARRSRTGAEYVAWYIGFRIARNQPEANDSPIDKATLTNSIGVKLASIPAGEFEMGSPPKDQDADAQEEEWPQHKVRISAFRMGVSEVTVGQFRRFAEDTGFKTGGEQANGRETWRNAFFEQTDQYPVVDVSWSDAVAFCNWLSRLDGLKEFYKIDGTRVTVPAWKAIGYRLPTEAEWEYACRAGTKTRFSCPEGELGRHAWYDFNGGRGPHPVGEKLPNGFGLFDMHGNVWEWCWDFYREDYYRGLPGTTTDPRGPDSGPNWVVRGGGYHWGAKHVRSAFRYWNRPNFENDDIGFRVARNQPGD